MEEHDDLAIAKGICNAISLSVLCVCLALLVIYA